MNRKQKRAAERQQRKAQRRAARTGPAGMLSAPQPGSFSTAQQMHQAGRLDEAAALYDAVLADNPDHAEALHFKGVLMFQKGDAGLGAPLIERALELRPDYPEALTNLGLLYRTLGRLDDAARCFRAVLQTHPGAPDVHNNLGAVYRDMGAFASALEAFAAATRLRPAFAEAWNNLGVAANALGRRDDAIAHFKRALELAPDYADAYMNLGNLLAETENAEAALPCHRKAVELAPDNAGAHRSLGATMTRLWAYDEAAGHLRRAVELAPDLISARIDLAVTLQRQGDISTSLPELRAALALEPENQIAWDNLAVGLKTTTLTQDDGWTVAEGEVAALKAAFPNSPEPGLLDMALHHVQPDTAAARFDAALAAMPASRSVSVGAGAGAAPRRALPEAAGVVALLNYGRSGSGLLHSLIDSHPAVSTFPGVLMKGYFAQGVWEQLSGGGAQELVARFIDMFEVMFDAASSKPVPSGVAIEDLTNIGVSEGLTAVGDNGDRPLTLDRARFAEAANALIAGAGEVDQGMFFRILHAAHDAALGREASPRVLFFHIHNPGQYALVNFLKHFPDAKLLMTVREPIQNAESWIKGLMQPPHDYSEVTNRISRLLSGLAAPYFTRYPSRAIAMEDLKRRPKETLAKLCDWLGIADDPALYRQTAAGEKWWGDPTGIDFQPGRERDPFDTASIDYPWGRVLSDNDIAVLGTLFRPFSAALGLDAVEGPRVLDLADLRTRIEAPLDLENRIFEGVGAEIGDPTRHVGFRAFHGLLRNRAAVLEAHGTYPDMIAPL
jgi:tetratricopeptide (TPR) repeat protein